MLVEILKLLSDTSYEEKENCVNKINNWDKFFQVAIEHGVAGLLYKKIPQNKKIPKRIVTAFQDCYYSNINNYVVCEMILKEISKKSKKEQIPFAIMRGVSLVEKLYKNPGLREFSDIDILVVGDKYQQMVELLKDIGFIQNQYLQNVLTKDSIIIDIHSEPLNAHRIEARGSIFSVDAKLIKNNLDTFYLNRTSLISIRKELNLLLLAYHIEKHSFSKIIWLYDFHLEAITFTKKSEWNLLYKYLEKTNLFVPFFHTMLISQKYLGTMFPAYIILKIQKKLGFSGRILQLLTNTIQLPEGFGPLLFALAEKSILRRFIYILSALFDLSEYKNEHGLALLRAYILLARKRFLMLAGIVSYITGRFFRIVNKWVQRHAG